MYCLDFVLAKGLRADRDHFAIPHGTRDCWGAAAEAQPVHQNLVCWLQESTRGINVYLEK